MPVLAYFFIAGAIAFVIYAVYHTRKEKEKEETKKSLEKAFNTTSRYTRERLEYEVNGEMLGIIENMNISEEHKEELREILMNNELDDNIIFFTFGSIQNQNLLMQNANIRLCALKHLIVFVLEKIGTIYDQPLIKYQAKPFIEDMHFFLGQIEPMMDKPDYRKLFNDVSSVINQQEEQD